MQRLGFFKIEQTQAYKTKLINPLRQKSGGNIKSFLTPLKYTDMIKNYRVVKNMNTLKAFEKRGYIWW